MVELTYLAIIIIAMAAMFFGYGFGLFEGRSQGYKKRQKEEAAEQGSQPPPQPETVTVTETVTVKVDDPGLLRIKNEQGAYTLDLDGARVNTPAMSPEQRRRLIEMLNVIRPWLEGKPAPTPVSPSAPAPASFAASTPLLDRAQPRPPSPPPPAPAPAAATIAREDRPSAPAGSIVSQIDSILQESLAGTPLESRGVFMTQSPQGGVIVYIGLTPYDGVDQVPDPEVKAAIRAATAEWERRHTPGL